MSAPVYPSGPEALAAALAAIDRGELVIVPHATNYNVVCDADSAAAVDAIFRAKQRTKLGPLPLCLPDAESVDRYVHVPGWFDREAMRALWPGEVCFVFRQSHPFPDRLTCGLRTVAVTVTSEPFYAALARAAGRPLASSSANISGQASGRVTLPQALADLGAHVALAVDGGAHAPSNAPAANTIVDLTFERPLLVREGAVPTERIRRYLPTLDDDTEAYRRRLLARAATVQQAQAQ